MKKNHGDEEQRARDLFYALWIPDLFMQRVKDDKEWTKYNSQLDAAKKLNLHASNINKVIKGILKTTGGYIFKLHDELYKSSEKTWNEIKEENEYENKCVGQPSINRVLHEKRDNNATI